MAITRRDGKVAWTMKLPGEGHGPGRSWPATSSGLASSKGALVSVDAATGKVASTQDLG